MEHLIKLYSYVNGINDIPFPSETEQVIITSFKYEANRMAGAPIITSTIKHRLCLDDLWTDNVYGTFNGEKYFIRSVPSSSKSNDDTRYEHNIELLSEREILNHVYFIDAVQGDSSTDVYKTNTTKFQFMGNIHEFANRLNASLQYSNLDYSVIVDSGISSEDKLVSFEDKYILEAIQEIFNTYEIPYYFVGKVIHIGYTENAITHVFKYGHDEALLKISKDNANYQVINRITGIGSSDNLPYYYPNESDDRAAIIASGKKWITPSQNLMPPIYRETNGAERFYNAKNNTYSDGEGGYYHFNNEYTPNNPLEGKQTFEDIKPTIKGMTNARGERVDMFMEFAYDRNDSDEVDEEGNYLHPYFFAKLRKTDGANGFNLFEHAIESQAMQISMTSGDCGACTFEIGVGEDTQQNIVQVDENGDLLRDEDGNVVRSGTPQPQQNDTKNYEVWLALRKDDSTYSTLMPDASFNLRPSTNDTFVILGISLPQGYITRAEDELMKSIIKYMYMNNDEKFTFSIGFSRVFFAEHPEILSQLNENSRLIIEYNGKQHTLYVNSFNYTMSDSQPLPEIQIDLVDTLTIGQNSLQTALDSVKQDILTSIGGGDFLQNGLRYFLRKDTQDTAREKITFKKGLDVGNFSSNVSGGTFREDENGNSYVETDTLFVRKKAIFQEYQIKKVSYIGGEYICSAASMDRIFRVEEYDTFYRCYANDGSSSYENEFVAGDQVICRMSDLAQENVVNRYYWRYVMAVGSNYIDLSKSDADADSDIPVEGDILVQLGNRNDKTRQNAIIISSVSVDAPSLKLLRAINSYSLDGKDDMSQGFDTSTGRGFLKIIGDFFAGAADNSTYVKYDAGRKVLEIKGKFLTGTGDSIEDIINNIQNQVDGAIETWFYTPEPTLDNEPAVNWTTKNDKNNHLGDLYYSGEGKAYRFQKDDDNYIWKLIQDTDITKALEAANQARQEAEEARQEAEEATDRLNKWASDGIISPTEKQSIKDEITRIDADHTHINSEYTKYALGTPDAYNSAYTAYRAVLVALSADTPETIDIPNDFATKQNKYYTERINALDAISSKSVQLIEDAKTAADAAKDAADNAQDTADGLKNFTDKAFADGIVTRAEAAAIEKYINTVKETQQSVNGTYNTLYSNAYLLNDDGSDTEERKALKSAYDTLTASINNLINKINSAIQDGMATTAEKLAVDAAYTTFNTNLNGYNVAVENANKAIQDRLKGFSDEYAYLKKAFENDTSIEGGVVATSLVQLGFKDSTGKYNIKSGINGIYDDEVLGNGISYWAGGLPIDREMYDEGSVPSNAATALIRMDGTGYLAGGNISWDANGKITTNKGAFYFGDELIDRYLDLFTIHVVDGEIDYITQNHPFDYVDVNKRIRIGDAYLEWDSANNGIKVYGIHGESVGLYAFGYVSSLGVSDTAGGGGAVDLLQDWDMYDSTTAKSIALSAFLGKDLLDRITSLENGKKGHTVVISGTGNIVTNVIEDGNTLTFTKGYITIDKITDLNSSWDALLKAAPAVFVTRWPSISEVTDKQNLVLKLNGGTTEGTSQFTYNGTSAKSVNITTANIGADAKFVTALGTSGNYLTWTKNGTTNNITVPYATNADMLDGVHESSLVRMTGRNTIYTSDQAPYAYIHLFRVANSSAYSTLRIDVDVKTRYHAAILHIDIQTKQYPYGDGGSSITIHKQTCNGRSGRFYYKRTVQSSGYNYYDIYYQCRAWNSGSYGIISKGSNGTLVYEPKGTNIAALPDGCTELSETSYPGNASTATKLQTARQINGTNFDGSANITTAKWGTARSIYIRDASQAHTGAAVSVDGSANEYLLLPSTIAAALDGNATSATKLQTARTLWGQSFNGTANVSGIMTGMNGFSSNWNDTWSDGTNNHPWYGYDHRYPQTGVYSSTFSDYFGLTLRTSTVNLSMTSKGNVGIGTYSPQYKLHVAGTGCFTDLLTANGGILVPSSKTLKIGSGTISWDTANNMFHFSHGLYSDGAVSALGVGSASGGGGGGSVDILQDWAQYDAGTAKSTALSAYLGYEMRRELQSTVGNIGNTPDYVCTLDLSDIDLDVARIQQAVLGKRPMFYIVTDNSVGNYVVGTMCMFSDNSHHVLTQVLTTHFLVQDGVFSAHVDSKVYTYYRSYNFGAPGLEGPTRQWTEWREAYGLTGEGSFMGVATPSTAAPSLAYEEEAYYVAATAGTYANLGGLTVASGEVALIRAAYSPGDPLTSFSKTTLSKAGGAVTIASITDLHSSWDSVLKAQKPSWLTSVSIATISDLNSGWDALLKAAPSSHITRWPTFSEVSSKPTTLSGYGITDAVGASDAVPEGMTITRAASSFGLTLKTIAGGDLDELSLPMATTSLAGLMSASDKSKLNSALTSVSLSTISDLNSGWDSVLKAEPDGLMDARDWYTLNALGNTAHAGAINLTIGSTYIDIAFTSLVGEKYVPRLPAATTTAAGLMSASDKTTINYLYGARNTKAWSSISRYFTNDTTATVEAHTLVKINDYFDLCVVSLTSTEHKRYRITEGTDAGPLVAVCGTYLSPEGEFVAMFPLVLPKGSSYGTATRYVINYA